MYDFAKNLEQYLSVNYIFYAELKSHKSPNDFFNTSKQKELLSEEITTTKAHYFNDFTFGTFGFDLKASHADFYKEHSVGRALIRLIIEKGYDPVVVYKKARIDRKLFSKIRSHDNYIPSKKTMISFALSLELNLEETQKFLELAGYVLSNNLLADVIIKFYIEQQIHDIDTINNSLYEHGQSIL